MAPRLATAKLLVKAALVLALAAAVPPNSKAAQQQQQPAAARGRRVLAAAPQLPLDTIRLPPGFSISLYDDYSIPARFLALGQVSQEAVVTYVSSTKAGVVTALVDRRGSAGVEACTLLSGLDTPNGVAYDRATGSLYVAEVRAITRHDNVDAAALAGCDASLLASTQVAGSDVLPAQAGHSNRFLGIGPADGNLYVTVAAPFNVDVCSDPYCTIHRLNKDGSAAEIFARGIRNAAGWDWHPQTNALLFAGMERDYMGDNLPDDLLGAIDRPGMNFTWPYCHWEGEGPPEQRLPGPGQAIPDSDLTLPGSEADGQGRPSDQVLAQRCSEVAPPPLQALGPHVAPLGVLYWQPGGPNITIAASPSISANSSSTNSSSTSSTSSTNSSSSNSSDSSWMQLQRWPADYDGGVFVAQHGSWNREPPLGYRVAQLQLAPDGRSVQRHVIFAEGWLQANGKAWGRPVGLLRLPDGSMLVGDDAANVVYRISYNATAAPEAPAPAPSSGSSSCTCLAGLWLFVLLQILAVLVCLAGTF